MKKQAVIFFVILQLCNGDVYLHSPRGSNNRLNEQSATRTNNNRMFDSQNNARGGYNVGDKEAQASGGNEEKQYRMEYFQSSSEYRLLSDGQGESYLTFEWTNQHGCGGNEDSDPHKQNCNIVLQYMCQPDVPEAAGTEQTKQTTMRNGVNTNSQNYNKPNNLNENKAQAQQRSNIVNKNVGLHEPWYWYDQCFVRERNHGLFTADQKLTEDNGLGYSGSIYTRQNNDGDRSGYECPEERDYYPYWHPTPWKDIALLAENETICSHYTENSFNVRPYHECVEYWDDGTRKHYSRWNNRADCDENGGSWTLLYNFLEKATDYQTEGECNNANGKKGVRLMWQIPHDTLDGKTKECLVVLDKPHCQEAPWTRSNHLGDGRYGEPNNYTWVIPHFPSETVQRCILRIRYNISTDDYDPYNTDYRHNENKDEGILSPVQGDPYVNVGSGVSTLRLAINTAQFGRTFQDRTHLFKLNPRPNGLEKEKIYNLNVRGKRGNIVQTYPAVEYDFFPTTLQISDKDLVHIQWTGSNTHNNGNPAGDGQSGSDGEGKAGTDRNNMVQISDRNDNFPMPFEQTTIWSSAEIVWIHHGKEDVKPEDLAISMASSGYAECVRASSCPEANLAGYIAETKQAMQNQLDNAPASYKGALLRFRQGIYHYMCTRNNNFTNRSQKGTIKVDKSE